jgi:hypothetical protein
MSTYEEIKEQLTAKSRENIAVVKRIQSFETDLDGIEVSKRELLSKKETELQSERRVQLGKAVETAVLPLEEEHKNIKLESVDVLNKYKQSLSSCNEDKVYDELRARDSISEDVKCAVTDIRALIVNDIGERFENEYVRQLKTNKTNLSESALRSFVNRFHKLNKRATKFTDNKRFDLSSSIAKSIDRISREKLQGDTKGVIILSGVLLAVMLLFAWVAFPIYLGFLTFMTVSNIRKGRIYSTTLREYKVIVDNLEKIELLLRSKAKKEISVRLAEIDGNYRNESDRLEKEGNTLRAEISRVRSFTEQSFEFNGDTINRAYIIANTDLDKRKVAVENGLIQAKRDQTSIQEEVQKLSERLKESSKELQFKYLDFTKVGEEKLLDSTFLLDIKDNKPVSFNHPLNSCIFLYDDLNDANDFIRLMSSQLRTRMNPFFLRMQLWDKEFMGVNFSSFFKKKPELFKVSPSQEKIHENLEELNDLISKRVAIILKEYENIAAYNTHMIELDSLTESYQFLFVLKPPQNLLTDDMFSQVLGIGPSVGIYSNIFIPQEDLKQEYIPMIKKCGRVFVLKNGEMSPKAKDFVLEHLVQFKN